MEQWKVMNLGEMGRNRVRQGLVGHAMEFSWKGWEDIEVCLEFR